MFKTFCWLVMFGVASDSLAEGLPLLNCIAEQTAGFHDQPDEQELYEPALFHPARFELEENLVFRRNLLDPDVEQIADLYLTLRMANADASSELASIDTELECRQVRGADGSPGFSCVNLPPSQMLLLNTETLRFTRASVGGWTFVGAGDAGAGAAGAGDAGEGRANPNANGGDSIYVEYGQCASITPSGSQPGF